MSEVKLQDVLDQVTELKDVAIDQVKKTDDRVENIEKQVKDIGDSHETFKKDVEQQIRDAKSFSLPGVEDEKKEFSFGKAFIVAMGIDTEEDCGYEAEVLASMKTKSKDPAVQRVAQATGNTGVGRGIREETEVERR